MRVIEQDCITGMAQMEAGSVGVVVTSPPYNLDIAYSVHNDAMDELDYLAWMGRVAREIERVLAPGGSLFLNVGGSNKKPWLPFDVAQMFREHLTLQNHIAWVKSISIGDVTSGHFKPINSSRFLGQNHEFILHFTKTGEVPLDRLAVGVPFMDKSNIERRAHSQDRRCAGNVWFIPYKTVKSRDQKFNHPAGFPLDLPLRCLRLAGPVSGLVLDPFLGTGTTLVAARELGLDGVGFEIDPTYAAVARERLL